MTEQQAGAEGAQGNLPEVGYKAVTPAFRVLPRLPELLDPDEQVALAVAVFGVRPVADLLVVTTQRVAVVDSGTFSRDSEPTLAASYLVSDLAAASVSGTGRVRLRVPGGRVVLLTAVRHRVDVERVRTHLARLVPDTVASSGVVPTYHPMLPDAQSVSRGLRAPLWPVGGRSEPVTS